MKKSILYFLLLGLTLGFAACGDEDGHDHNHDSENPYHVNVTFMMPMENTSVAPDSDIHIHVDMAHAHDETIHNVKVEVMDANGAVISTLVDEHVHEMDGTYSYHNMAYIVPSITGTYTIKASTTDHDGENEQSGIRGFVVE